MASKLKIECIKCKKEMIKAINQIAFKCPDCDKTVPALKFIAGIYKPNEVIDITGVRIYAS